MSANKVGLNVRLANKPRMKYAALPIGGLMITALVILASGEWGWVM